MTFGPWASVSLGSQNIEGCKICNAFFNVVSPIFTQLTRPDGSRAGPVCVCHISRCTYGIHGGHPPVVVCGGQIDGSQKGSDRVSRMGPACIPCCTANGTHTGPGCF